MTDRTLSPAAQAVLDEAMEFSGPAFESLVRKMLAAALRAAADQVLAAQWEGRIHPDAAHSLGINWTRDALQAIAAELEGSDD
jgi:hypothetical protein